MGHFSASILAAGEGGGGGGNNFLIPNGTFFVVLIIFLIVLGVIGTFVVPPITRVLRERDAMVRKTVEDNRKSSEQFAAAKSDYDKAMAVARKEATAVREQARTEGRKIIEEMRGRASEQAETALRRAAAELKQQGDAIGDELRSSVGSLATALASRVLGVDVGADRAKTSGKAPTTVSGR
ncbi:MAG: F0F1 ATP synthase subunit B [Mycobacteriaceae bacterium]|nr:F0F1 ATP synthase subunit B [Mycobacteriaceae bacterium]MBV9640486.1 F0F1 ATP synthase subunit B [Mycobacteriaceae bacterium]